jgi:hypothetical protein
MFKNRYIPTKAQEAAEDVFFGQIAIIWARWFLIGAGSIITLWSGEDQFMMGVGALVILMTMNFFFHARYMTGKPVNQFMLLLGNIVDLAVVTSLVIFWDHKHTGLNSHFFILYYPMVFSWALVFSPRITVIFCTITVAVYAITCLFFTDLSTFAPLNENQLQGMLSRVITLGAMGGLGTYYYRRQRDSLRALISTKTAPMFK